MAFIPLLVCLLVLSFVLVLQASRDYRRRRGFLYPPGPQPLPIIGNLLDVPAEFSWLLYTQLAKKYGTPSALFKACFAQRLQGMSCLFTFLGGSWSYWAPPNLPKICLRRVVTFTLIAP
jgi:hypothetical protein